MSQDPTLVPQSTASPPRARQLGRRPLLVFWAAALALGGLDRAAWATSEGAVGTLVVNVVGIGEHSGTVVALLFNHNDGFPAKVAKACQRTSAKVTGGTVTLRFTELPLGTYAVTVYHDVNDNQKLDTNWIGIPKEPVAVSNNAKGRLGPPKWKDATFELREAMQELTVNLVKI